MNKKGDIALIILGIVAVVAVIGLIMVVSGATGDAQRRFVSEESWRGWEGGRRVLPTPLDVSGTCCRTINYVNTALFSAADEAECFAYGRAKGLDVYFKQGHYDDVCDPLKWDKESRRDRR